MTIQYSNIELENQTLHLDAAIIEKILSNQTLDNVDELNEKLLSFFPEKIREVQCKGMKIIREIQYYKSYTIKGMFIETEKLLSSDENDKIIDFLNRKLKSQLDGKHKQDQYHHINMVDIETPQFKYTSIFHEKQSAEDIYKSLVHELENALAWVNESENVKTRLASDVVIETSKVILDTIKNDKNETLENKIQNLYLVLLKQKSILEKSSKLNFLIGNPLRVVNMGLVNLKNPIGAKTERELLASAVEKAHEKYNLEKLQLNLTIYKKFVDTAMPAANDIKNEIVRVINLASGTKNLDDCIGELNTLYKYLIAERNKISLTSANKLSLFIGYGERAKSYQALGKLIQELESACKQMNVDLNKDTMKISLKRVM